MRHGVAPSGGTDAQLHGAATQQNEISRSKTTQELVPAQGVLVRQSWGARDESHPVTKRIRTSALPRAPVHGLDPELGLVAGQVREVLLDLRAFPSPRHVDDGVVGVASQATTSSHGHRAGTLAAHAATSMRCARDEYQPRSGSMAAQPGLHAALAGDSPYSPPHGSKQRPG